MTNQNRDLRRWPKGAAVVKYRGQLLHVHEPCGCGTGCHGVTVSAITDGTIGMTPEVYIVEALTPITPLARDLLDLVQR